MTPGLLAGFSTIGHCQPCSGPTPAMLATEFERPAAGAVDDGCNRPSMAFSSHSFALAWVGCPTVQRHGGCYLVCLLGRFRLFEYRVRWISAKRLHEPPPKGVSERAFA